MSGGCILLFLFQLFSDLPITSQDFEAPTHPARCKFRNVVHLFKLNGFQFFTCFYSCAPLVQNSQLQCSLVRHFLNSMFIIKPQCYLKYKIKSSYKTQNRNYFFANQTIYKYVNGAVNLLFNNASCMQQKGRFRLLIEGNFSTEFSL